MAGPSGLFAKTVQVGDIAQPLINMIPRPGAVTQVGGGTIVVPGGPTFTGLDGVNWRAVQFALTIGANTYNLWLVEKYNTNASFAGGGAFTNAWIPVEGVDIEDTNGATTLNSGYRYTFTAATVAADTVIEGNNYYVSRLNYGTELYGSAGPIISVEVVSGGAFVSAIQLGPAIIRTGPSNSFVHFDPVRGYWYWAYAVEMVRADSSGGPIANTLVETDLTAYTVPANKLADGDHLRGCVRLDYQVADLVNAANANIRCRYDTNQILNHAYLPSLGVPYLSTIYIRWELHRQGTNINYYFEVQETFLPVTGGLTVTTGALATAFNANKVMKFTVQFTNLSVLNIMLMRESEWRYSPAI